MMPVRIVAAKRYSIPCLATNGPISDAIAPVAAEIIPIRPPTMEMVTAIQKDAYKPTIGSTPAKIEKAIASGMSANATVIPDRMSCRVFENHAFFSFWYNKINLLMSYDF